MIPTAAYIRVSTAEQAMRGYSLQAQHDSLEQYAREHDLNIVGWYADEGVSARKPIRQRPAFCRMLEDIEADKIRLVIFIKLDRFFRNVRAYYEAMPVFEAHNVTWKAIFEDYSNETANDRLKLNLFLSIAENESDRTSERIRYVNESKKARGELTSGSVPLGLKLENKTIVPDPDAAQAVVDLYQHMIDTRSTLGCCKYALEKYHHEYTTYGMKYILTNQRYLEYGVIDKRTFDTVQEIISQRSRKKETTDRVYLFAGLCRCPSCGSVMRSTVSNGGSSIFYQCSRHARYGAAACSYTKMVNERTLERWLLDNLVREVEKYNLIITAESKAPTIDKAAIKRKMDKLKGLYLEDLIDHDTYEHDYRQLKEKLDSVPVPNLIDIESLKDIESMYQSLPKGRRKAFWSRVVKSITPKEDSFLITFELPKEKSPDGIIKLSNYKKK